MTDRIDELLGDNAEETHPEQQEADDNATTTESEEDSLPAVLKDETEEEPNEDEESVDLSPPKGLDEADLAKWISQKEKGIQKVVQRAQEREKQAQEALEQFRHYQAWEEALSNPETREAAFAQIAQMYQIAPSSHATEPTGEGESKYGLAFASDDQVLERAVQLAIAEVRKELDPLIQDRQAAQAEKAAVAKANGTVQTLRSQYGDWITPELVKEAIIAFPTLEPTKAFLAQHGNEVVRKVAEFASTRGKSKTRDMVTPGSNERDGRESPPLGSPERIDFLLDSID